jgi:hypothetical protein
MTEPRTPTVRAPLFAQRGMLLAVAAALLVTLCFSYAGTQWPLVVERWLLDGIVLTAWLAAAWGIGVISTPSGDLNAPARPLLCVTRVAIGLGVMSLLILGLGLAGWLNRVLAWFVVSGGCLLAASRIRPQSAAAAMKAWLQHPARWEWLWLLCLPVASIAVIAALLPPGVMWGDEPHGYDVLSYHLQIPREWYERGQISPLEHNVFSYMPLGVEMHYLLAMHLAGGPWAGMYLAQFMHLTLVALSIAAVFGAVRAASPTPCAVIAAVAAASVPFMAMLGSVGYNEGGLLLFGALSIAWTMLWLRERSGIRPIIIAGALAGFACGAKLTAVPVVLLAVPVVVLVVAAASRALDRRVFAAAAAYILSGLCTCSPWLIRNQVWAHNPIFPEGQSILGQAHFSDVQAERWRRAHSPREDQASVAGRALAISDQILLNWRFGYVVIPLGLLAAVVSWRRRREVWLLFGMLAALLVIWTTATHLQGRFSILAVPIAAMLVGMVTRHRWVFALVVTAAAIAAFLPLHSRLREMLDDRGYLPLLAVPDMAWAMPAAVRQMPQGEPLALIGDAAAFKYDRPMSLLHYRTVFDVDGDGASAWTKGVPIGACLLIDPRELSRLSTTYQPIPPAPSEWMRFDKPVLLPPPDHDRDTSPATTQKP